MEKDDFTPAADLEAAGLKPAPNDCGLMMSHDYTGKKCPVCDFVFLPSPPSDT